MEQQFCVMSYFLRVYQADQCSSMTTSYRYVFQYDYFSQICIPVCHAVLSVSCSLVVSCWERADLFDVFLCLCHFPIIRCPAGVLLDQVWYLIVLIPDPHLLPYFVQFD